MIYVNIIFIFGIIHTDYLSLFSEANIIIQNSTGIETAYFCVFLETIIFSFWWTHTIVKIKFASPGESKDKKKIMPFLPYSFYHFTESHDLKLN